MDKSKKVEQAVAYFMQGYNCAQAVFTAFHEELGLKEDFALRLSSSFGGGMGGLRGTCGAVSSMFMVLGALQGYDVPDDMAAKRQLYARVQELAARFQQEYGTTNCRELLQRCSIEPSNVPAERNAEYYASRPCARYVEACARLVEEALQQN